MNTRSLKLYARTRKKRIGPEARLQCAIVEHLRLRGIHGLIYFSIPNERRCSVEQGYYLKRMGLLPGAADLCILVPGDTPAFLELKSPTGELTTDQIAFARLAHENGSRWRVCSDISSALAQLEAWGALRADRSTVRRRVA